MEETKEMKRPGLFKRVFMNTMLQMKLGEGNFLKRVDNVVVDAKIELKGGANNNVQEENCKEES